MAMNALFIGWGPVISGREQKSLQVFDEVIQYYTRLQQQGEIDSFEPIALEPHGGDLNGFCLVRGEPEKLNRLRNSEEFIRLNTRGLLVVDNLGVVGAWTGAELNSLFEDYAKQLGELT